MLVRSPACFPEKLLGVLQVLAHLVHGGEFQKRHAPALPEELPDTEDRRPGTGAQVKDLQPFLVEQVVRMEAEFTERYVHLGKVRRQEIRKICPPEPRVAKIGGGQAIPFLRQETG
jgi:hypothetical protein